MTTVVLTTSQPWSAPANVHHVDVVVVGGGRDGQSGDWDYTFVDGPGGKAGQVVSQAGIAVTAGAQYTITVGARNAGSSAFGLTAETGGSPSGGPTPENGYTGVAGYPTAGNGAHNSYWHGEVYSNGGVGYGAGGGGGESGGGGYYPGAGGLGAPGVVIITYYVTVPSFSADSTSGISPKTVTFTGAGTETPTAWAWDFGDGSTSTSQSPAHQYTATGKKTVSLTVSNAYSTVTETKTDYITIFWQPNAHATIVRSDWLRGGN
jgi:PKD repeat protein